jgi:hypothetical protein
MSWKLVYILGSAGLNHTKIPRGELLMAKQDCWQIELAASFMFTLAGYIFNIL